MTQNISVISIFNFLKLYNLCLVRTDETVDVNTIERATFHGFIPFGPNVKQIYIAQTTRQPSKHTMVEYFSCFCYFVFFFPTLLGGKSKLITDLTSLKVGGHQVEQPFCSKVHILYWIAYGSNNPRQSLNTLWSVKASYKVDNEIHKIPDELDKTMNFGNFWFF